MKLQDYLHYYMGCKAITTDDNEQAELVGVSDDNAHLVHDGTGSYGTCDISGVKPILRRLEDMTEVEGVDLAKLQHNPTRHKDIEVLYIKTEHLHYIDGTRWSGDGVSEYNEYFVDFSQMKADQFHYLLSKGFDLFGLIDAGLAVDIKTVES